MDEPGSGGDPESESGATPEVPESSAGVTSDAAPDDQTDPALEAVLAELWTTWSQQRGPLSLARLCKRTGLRMSTLKRFLTELERCGIAGISINARGVECAALTDTAAASLAEAAAGAAPGPELDKPLG